ncbi:MAG TPA: hypothetical protein VJV79_29665 [Polyangiaceae bacterium]|nr:hypothetical protein [Polyangiaceae bacterium]
MSSTDSRDCIATRTSAAFFVSGCMAVTLLVTACGGSDSGSEAKGGTAGAAAPAAGASSTGGSAIGSGGATGVAGLPGSGGVTASTGGQPGGGTAGSGTTISGGTGGSSTGGSAGSSSVGGSSTAGGSGVCAGATPISKATCTAGESNCFSFFVASRARMFKLAQAFNGSTKGWGGDFRYGTADGLTGADKLCTQVAEESLPGNCRTWRAFLTTSKVNAITRVGSGPWYDRLNRTIAKNLTELASTRPGGITVSTILNNLPNEDGTPHHNEEAGCTNANSCADNHDVLTGSDSDGKACTATTCAGIGGIGMGMGGGNITDWTCKDWTLGTATAGIAPRCGHTWPTMTGGTDDWISRLTETGCAPGYNLVQNGGPMATGNGSVGDGGGYGAIYCLALSE